MRFLFLSFCIPHIISNSYAFIDFFFWNAAAINSSFFFTSFEMSHLRVFII